MATFMDAEDKLHKAKIKLQDLHPFFAYLIMHMEGHEDEKCPTMAVDGNANLYYNKAYVESLSDSLLRSCLTHEITHIILSHIHRYHRDWNPQLANIAADILSNDLLDTEGFELDPSWIVPHNHSYTFQGKNGGVVIDKLNEKTMEEVYYILEKNVDFKPAPSCAACGGTGKAGGGGDAKGDGEGDKDGDQDNGGQCPHCNGTGTDGQAQIPGISGKSQDEHRVSEDKSKDQESKASDLPDEWKHRLAEAASFAKQQGSLSAFVSELVDGLVESKVDWRSQLLKYISAALPFNYTWSRPAKKSASLGIYLPNVVKESLEVVVHIDTSGSIDPDTLKEFLSEIRGILVGFTAVEMTLIICDCEVQEVFDLTPDNVPELAELPMKGRGGTSHRPVVNWIVENKPMARVFITLTDGYSDIESCYDDLPMCCDRLILLDRHSSDMADRLEAYGEIIKLSDEG